MNSNRYYYHESNLSAEKLGFAIMILFIIIIAALWFISGASNIPDPETFVRIITSK